ncbi:helix-turn-helix domain-containing protein [Variovorax ginsengisoli]|uniref:DNA-binding response OmpR family regulator n=1 Tax=Variovorax ginsengisoli TaxID=363844 RepID=A0ABT9S4A7_9BURK|nr:helix-turn-helix domain-containing protein [Variovorax ginsengisoli]MDP9899187.1 DNA-binding response OmpR family regulator [Variovorax ginsengisoli]
MDLTLAEHLLLKEMLRGEHQLVPHKRWALLTGTCQKESTSSKPSRTFHMTISRLRRKVHAVTMLNLPVRARHGVGYQFCGRLQEVSETELVE